MNKAIAKRWVKALRSGKYKQGQYTLKHKDCAGTVKYCCLGVLTELYQNSMRRQGKRGLKEAVVGGNMTAFSAGRDDAQNTALIPRAVMKWAGMQTDAGDYPPSPCSIRVGSLAEDNDNGKSFKQIARIIETHAEEL